MMRKCDDFTATILSDAIQLDLINTQPKLHAVHVYISIFNTKYNIDIFTF